MVYYTQFVLVCVELLYQQFLQILMNVLRVEIAVLRHVQILLGVIHAHVVQAIIWQVMDKHAMVN